MAALQKILDETKAAQLEYSHFTQEQVGDLACFVGATRGKMFWFQRRTALFARFRALALGALFLRTFSLCWTAGHRALLSRTLARC